MEKIVHEVVLNGYNADAGGTLDLGTWGSYGIEQLHLTTDEAWDGTVITANFNVENEVVAQAVADADGIVNVPWEALKNNTFSGKIVFVGDRDKQRRITADIRFKVRKHGDYLLNGDANAPAPTDDRWNQFVSQNKAYRDDAVAAANQAQLFAGTAEDAKKAAELAQIKTELNAEQAAQSAENAKIAEESAQKSKEDAAASAEFAQQIAAKNGYMQMRIDDEGHLLYTRTTNMSKLKFDIVNDTNLEVTISG